MNEAKIFIRCDEDADGAVMTDVSSIQFLIDVLQEGRTNGYVHLQVKDNLLMINTKGDSNA